MSYMLNYDSTKANLKAGEKEVMRLITELRDLTNKQPHWRTLLGIEDQKVKIARKALIQELINLTGQTIAVCYDLLSYTKQIEMKVGETNDGTNYWTDPLGKATLLN